MTINISKQDYEENYVIQIFEWNDNKKQPQNKSLYLKLKELKFTPEQAEFLDKLFDKLVNREVGYK